MAPYGISIKMIIQHLWNMRRALPAAELRLECRAKSVACPQPQSLVTEDELKEMLAP